LEKRGWGGSGDEVDRGVGVGRVGEEGVGRGRMGG